MRFKKKLYKENGNWYIVYKDGVEPMKLENVFNDRLQVYSLVARPMESFPDQVKKGYHEYGSYYIFKEDAVNHIKLYNQYGHGCYHMSRYINLNKVVIDNKARKWIHLVPTKRYAHPIDVD